MWWPDEEKVSVLPERDVQNASTATVGKPCVVSYGKATYVGVMSAIGRFVFTLTLFSLGQYSFSGAFYVLAIVLLLYRLLYSAHAKGLRLVFMRCSI